MATRYRPSLTGPLATALVLGLCSAAALAIRIIWPYDNVVVDGAVWFREMDGWYHMRLVDSLLANFPHTTAFDPYTFFPHGTEPPFHPLTRWLIALSALVAGGGHPSAHVVDMTGALYPAVLGTLTIIPAYFIARRIAGPVAGGATAVVLAIMPGEFLSRSLFGFTDHHMTEAFFSTLSLLFLLLATDAAVAGPVQLRRMRTWLAPSSRRTVLYCFLAGFSLGLYFVGWRGGLMLLAVLLSYTVVRAVLDYARGVESDDVVLVCTSAVVIGGIMVSPLIPTHWTPQLYVVALLAAGLAPAALKLLAREARRRGWSTKAFVGSICAIGIVCVAAIGLAVPAAIRYAVNALDFLVPTGASLTIMEMHPLFLPGGDLSLRVGWTNFVTVLPASLIALLVLWRSRRISRSRSLTLFVVWSLFMLMAVLFQRRFGYYYSVNAAILTGCLAGWISGSDYVQTRLQSLGRAAVAAAAAGSKAARRAQHARQTERRSAVTLIMLLLLAFVALIVAPCLSMARNFATEPGLMTAGWYETLHWLRDNTTDPLGTGGYYKLYESPGAREDFDYPEGAWGVMAWWDFGHWITRASQRIPVANPFQAGARTAAQYFLSDSETDGLSQLAKLGCRYVVTDARTSVQAFHGVAAWGGHERTEYYEMYTQPTSVGGLETIVLYYPEYYQSALVRLHCFSGQSYEPERYRVVTFEDSGGLSGADKRIVAADRFATYQEALAFIEAGESDHKRLVSSDPFESCVPLEKLAGYEIVFESAQTFSLSGHRVPSVRVFEIAGE